MAWFRMMGRDSIEYHRATVFGRDDDHAGSAIAYYGTRGETPLVWGGKIAERLGLSGAVTDETYEAIFGKGGVIDPVLGVRLVKTARPGVELVVAAHKSVALLGVIGRADDMHTILDAETDATLAYLELWFERQGGRRGKTHWRTRTGGLLWARTRHATSRAGDPSPHDHVLIANVTEMLDTAGGWKALDTASIRDVNHAATMAGRVASAAVAVGLGYAIEPDPGPTGKLGHWRIAGIPQAACDAMSKRSDDIDLAMESSGFSSYRARGIAARATRAEKSDESPEQLLPRWLEELNQAGWPARKIATRLRVMNERAKTPQAPTDIELHRRAAEVLSADGALGNRKAFTRLDVVRVVAPSVYGLPVSELDRAVQAVINHQEAIPLVGQPGARQRAWAAASVLAAEQAVAEVSRRLARSDAPTVSPDVITVALTAKERSSGRALTDGQQEAVSRICAGGLGLDLIIGVAGSGKTTALDAVRAAYEADGYRVLGAATSGQAARALASEADVEARTVASLLWRLRAGTLRLDSRTLLLLDEAGMTDDRSMLAVLKAAEHAGAKVVVIGDHRQLCAVGLGGGLEALVGRHAQAVHTLDENVRQHDRGERRALSHLRDGNVERAVDWYGAHGRVLPAPTRDEALDAAVDRWHADETAGHRTLLLAWRRVDVAALNGRARERWALDGHLSGVEYVAPGGRQYMVGDRVVALAPTVEGSFTTSERGTVVASSVHGIIVRSDAGRTVSLTGDTANGEHLDHAYAVTVHRSQGATVDRTHLLADGGGRELAYVAMSRARDTTHIHVVADDLDQAIDDLQREWSVERRDRWTIDTDAPASTERGQRPDLAARVASGLRAARLRAEHDAVAATLPPDNTQECVAAAQRVIELEKALKDLRDGRGKYGKGPIGAAHRALDDIERHLQRAGGIRQLNDLGWRNRRHWNKQHREAQHALGPAKERLAQLVGPIETELTATLEDAAQHLTSVQRVYDDRRQRARIAGITKRLHGLEREMSIDHAPAAAEIDHSHGIEL